MKKLTQEELEKDISSNISYPFFKYGSYNNTTNYARRSFNDLYGYYWRKGVTEKMIMKAIINLNLIAMYCSTPKRYVFYQNSESPNSWFSGAVWGTFKPHSINNCGKYDAEYLDKLYDEVKKEKEE